MNKKEEVLLKKLLSLFRVEAQEHLNAITSGLIELEKGTGEEQPRIVEAIYREAHSLKGASRSVNLTDIETVCQSFESVFAALKHKGILPSPGLLDVLHQSVDMVGRLIHEEKELTDSDRLKMRNLDQRLESAVEELENEAAEFVTPGKEPGKREQETARPFHPAYTSAETVRISVDKLDSILLQAEELLSIKLASAQHASELRTLRNTFNAWRKDLAKIKPGIRESGSKEEKVSEAVSLTSDPFIKTLESTLTELEKSAEYDHRAFGGMVDNLLDDMKKTLMFPFSSLLDLFPKFVRDLSRDVGKQVTFTVHGGDIEIDRRILEEMKDPLIHLVRNCIDHGIEYPAERERKKKPPYGTICLSIAAKDSSKIEIVVSDDGAGIDTAEIKANAIKKGILSQEEATRLNEEETLTLIFQSGITTSPIITDVSGRGLGLAIVREKVEKLGGGVRLDTKPDQGTIFTITLPLSLATFRGLLVRINDRIFVLPITNVERVLRAKREEIKTVKNRETLPVSGQVLSITRLGDVLELPPSENPADIIQVVVLRSAERRMAFLADEILNEQEVLVKTLGRQLSRVRNIAGATVLGNGKVVPFLNVSDLMKSAMKSISVPAVTATPDTKIRRNSILVVEDSITARTLLKNILNSAGYEVKTAVDGADAFAALKTGEFDLVVSDIQMPRMNGFDLTARIRGDKKLSELPVILVTALETREHRERGIEVGANAYIVKSSFDQSNLLEVIQRLI